MPHGDLKKDSDRRCDSLKEETVSKRKELLRGKLDRNKEKWMIKNNAMEYHAVWITDGLQEKKM